MIGKIIILCLAMLAATVYIILLLTSGKYDKYIEQLDEKDFRLKGLYSAGFKLIDTLNFRFQGRRANEARDNVKILYGERYAEFYLRVVYAQQISLAMLTFVIMSMFSCMAGEDMLLMFVMGTAVSFLVYYYLGQKLKKDIQNMSLLYLSDFPSAVSTIALLFSSGMTLREAWKEVAYSDMDNKLYRQMQRVTEDINNGISEPAALYAFSIRCATPEIKKFTSLVIQGLDKGPSELAHSLKNQSEELWEIKKQKTLQLGDEAASKLLIPIAIIFVGLLIIIMGPMMSSLNI